MLPPELKLASLVHKNPGGYALLLGSGTSSSAGVRTGWGVTLDLVGRWAVLHGQESPSDPAQWWQQTQGSSPSYSYLLQELAPRQSERTQLLEGYFEPGLDQLGEPIRAPQLAHRAIADLVKTGIIRIIITTNFDRLLENALEAVDVTPTRISAANSIASSLPVQHYRCVILKVHGDFRDTPLKNTTQELSAYEAEWNTLLSQVFSQYGLIICGWSAQWDPALAALLTNNPCVHFSTFYTHISPLEQTANAVVAARHAETIQVSNADEFFDELRENIFAMATHASRQEPLSEIVAVERVKKYISEPSSVIKLHDLVMNEADKVWQQMEALDAIDKTISEDTMAAREQELSVLAAMLMTGFHWGSKEHHKIWCKALERIVHSAPRSKFNNEVISGYPGLFLFHAAGIGAITALRYDNLSALFNNTKYLQELATGFLGKASYWLIRSKPLDWSWLSVRLYSKLQRIASQYLHINEPDFGREFDWFEYLFNLQSAFQQGNVRNAKCGVGRYFHTDLYGQLYDRLEKDTNCGEGVVYKNLYRNKQELDGVRNQFASNLADFSIAIGQK